jgi:O-antigen/teichoic acid export membrane protein
VVMSFLSALFIYIFYDAILRFLDNDKIGSWLYFIPFSVLLIGFFQSFSYWHNRKKSFKSISYAKVLKSGTTASVQLGGGAGGFEALGLIPGLIAGQFISALTLGVSFFKMQRGLLREVTLKRMLRLGALYKNFPLFNTLMGLLNTLSNQLPVFLLTRFFGLSSAAYYGLANRIIGAPTGLIGQSVGQVFYQKAADVYNKKSGFYRLVKNIYRKLFLAAVPLFTALTALSFFFGFIFGAEWETAGTYALILIPWLFMMFINSPITFIIAILNRQKQMVVYDIFLLLSRGATLYAGFVFFNSAFYSLFFFSLSGLIFNGILMVYLLYIARKAES